ncbi:carbohydrate-binding module family 13 protein [Rhizophagus irregularis DAOM 181602=DAOM 197198]|nr:carbohydrate-binding module family 13 protein [Rhizophagus irregularis DAOM 181602=DAOM 197198]
MVILNYRSPHLRRILSTNKKKNDGTLAHIKLPNILPDIFQIIIRYIYGGRISLIEYDILDIIKILVKILVAANELSLQELISHLQLFLIENNENWTEQNFNLIYQMTIENDSFLDLQKKRFSSCDFTSIPEKALISLIQHDNHEMGEVQVWEHILKWGIKIIPEELYEDTIKYFLDKNSKNLDSIIITTQHAELISKWINRLEITDELKNSYEFKLILLGSRDGFTAKRFHEICDNQSHTVTIFKVKDTNEILGEYNPIEWKNDYGIFRDYGTTKDSFIFSFMNKESIKDHIISRVKDEYYAICYCYHYGSSFIGDKDLTIYGGHEGVASFRNKKSYCQENSYEKQIRKMEDDFSVEEYEVFQIINDN